MLIISSREFRQNQKNYFDKIDDNEQVIIRRGKNKSYRIIPVNKYDTILSEEDFRLKILESINQAKDGNILVLTEEKQKELLNL